MSTEVASDERVARIDELFYAGLPSSTMAPEHLVRFGLFEFDLSSLELRRSGRATRLAPQPARALAVLLRNPGEVITREVLAREVWGTETFVDFDQGLNFCIRQIRMALGDQAESPRYIETIPKRGYRFVAPVERPEPVPVGGPEANAGRPDVQYARRTRSLRALPVLVVAALITVVLGYGVWSRVRASRLAAEATIAVLPFDDLSGGQTYFADGISEELATQLGRTDPALTVIGRTSMRPFRDSPKTAAEIGRDVGAAHLVDGTVRRFGNRVRVTAELIHASDQVQIWSDTFEADATEILTVQQQMGIAIARQVLARVGPVARSQPAVDPVVYDLYLQGRFYWNRRGPGVTRAREKFDQAIALDPRFARAYAGVGDCLMSGATFPEALKYAEQALALDAHLAEAHVTRAHALLHLFRWAESERAFQEAILIDPSLPDARYYYGEFLVAQGRAAEALKQIQQALAVDPLSAITTHAAGVVTYYAGHYDDARRLLRRAHELDPEHTWTEVRLALVDERQQAYADAIATFERLGKPLRGAYTYARAGQPDEARQLIAANLALPAAARDPYHLSMAYAGLGEDDEAIRWMSAAFQAGAYDAIYFAVEPRMQPLRTRADFRAVLAEHGWPKSVLR